MTHTATLTRLLLLLVAGLACGPQPMPRGAALPAADQAPGFAARPAPDYWPTRGWREATPESQGMSSALIADALLEARARNVPVHAVLVVRRGVVVLDANFYPFRRGDRHDLASVTKSVTSVVAGAGIAAGRLAHDTPLADVLPGLDTSDPRRRRITIENLLAMRSGLDCGFARGERELSAMQLSPNFVDFALRIPMRSEPGTEFGYCSPNYHLVSAAIQRAVGISEERFARRALFEPLGIANVNWPRDPQGVTHGWGNLQLTPRDAAKIGFLYLHGGRWERRQLVSRDWVVRSTATRASSGRNLYGLGWWSSTDAPPGFYEANGRGGQRISVWPEKDLVAVLLGGGYEPGVIGGPLLRALLADTALPPDPAGLDRLRAALDSIAAPPPPAPVSRSPLERAVSGRVFAVDSNSLGLRRIAIAFSDGAVATVRLDLRDRMLVIPLGLDNRLRIAGQDVDGIRPGGRAIWRTPLQFVVEVDLIGKIDHYTLAITFAGDEITTELSERTGLMRETIRGRALP